MYYEDIIKCAARVKRRFGGLNDPFKLCASLGIKLNPTPLGSRPSSVKGFYLRCSRIGVITYNTDLPYAEQVQVIWHELGHALLHSESKNTFADITYFDSAGQAEKEANLFSAEYQLSDQAVLDALSGEATLFSAASSLNVPVQLLDFKLRLMERKGYSVASPIAFPYNYLKNLELPASENDYV